MKVLMPVIGFAIGVFFLGWLLVTTIRLLGGVLGFGSRRLDRAQLAILEKYFLHYGRLPPKAQQRFRGVMAAFLRMPAVSKIRRVWPCHCRTESTEYLFVTGTSDTFIRSSRSWRLTRR